MKRLKDANVGVGDKAKIKDAVRNRTVIFEKIGSTYRAITIYKGVNNNDLNTLWIKQNKNNKEEI